MSLLSSSLGYGGHKPKEALWFFAWQNSCTNLPWGSSSILNFFQYSARLRASSRGTLASTLYVSSSGEKGVVNGNLDGLRAQRQGITTCAEEMRSERAQRKRRWASCDPCIPHYFQENLLVDLVRSDLSSISFTGAQQKHSLQLDSMQLQNSIEGRNTTWPS